MHLDKTIQALMTELEKIKVTLENSANETQQRIAYTLHRLAEIDLQYVAYGLILQKINPHEHAAFKRLLKAADINITTIDNPTKEDLENSTLLYHFGMVLNKTKTSSDPAVQTLEPTDPEEKKALSAAKEEIGRMLVNLRAPNAYKIERKPLAKHVDPATQNGNLLVTPNSPSLGKNGQTVLVPLLKDDHLLHAQK